MKQKIKNFIILILFVQSIFSGASAAKAIQLSDMLKGSGGLIVQLGCQDAGAITELAKSNYLVHALDSDRARVAAARKYVSGKGLYGKVSAEHWTRPTLPYVDNSVNVIVASGEGNAKVTVAEIARVLTPRGILLCRDAKRFKLGTLGFTKCAAPAGWSAFRKAVPSEIDDWPHWLYGPHNNAVSKDKVVGVSRNMQWIAAPKWNRHHNLLPSITTMISCNGRIYSIEDRGPIGIVGPHGQWVLSARDAFNGLQLWTVPIPKWGSETWAETRTGISMRFKNPGQVYRRLVANGDKVYVTLGFAAPLSEIDGATGKILQTYKGTDKTAAIFYDDGILYLSQNTSLTKPGKNILALDPKSGEILWKHTGVTGIVSRGDELKKYSDIFLTCGSHKLFFLDKGEIIALDKKTGKKVWSTPRPPVKNIFGHSLYNYVNLCTLVYHKGGVFLAQVPSSKTNLNRWQTKSMHIVALEADSGKERWKTMGTTTSHFTPPDLFVHHDMIWTLNEKSTIMKGLDIQTGETKKEYPISELKVRHHSRCYRNKGTANFYLNGEEGIEYIDFRSGELNVIHWVRGACAYGIMPANGYIYLPGHSCGCHADSLMAGFMALNSVSKVPQPTPDAERLVKGPVFDLRPVHQPSDSDWPVFRRDAQRSSNYNGKLPAKLSQKWEVSLGGNLTAPTIAGGLLYCASTDGYQLYALDTTTGNLKWTYFTNGPVDSPPTYHKGLLIFGTRTGYVICLEAATGRLAWKFQAAPADQRLGAYERIESAWPIHGSTLVQNDRIYVVAGRSMHLNSGLYTYVLDLKGKMLHKGHLEADMESKGEMKNAVLPDILVAKGDSIFMRSMAFNGDFKPEGTGTGHLQAKGGLLDDSWLNNAYWTLKGKKAQIMVFDSERAYGVSGVHHLKWKSAVHDRHKFGSGYKLYAYALISKSSKPAQPSQKGKKKKKKKHLWRNKIPIRAQAMILGKAKILLAGAVEDKASDVLWTSPDEQKPGKLIVHAKETGEMIGEHPLKSPPVLDGLAAGDGKVYLVLKNGQVVCFGE